MDLSALAVELGLGDVARVCEPARVFQASGERAHLPQTCGVTGDFEWSD
jgi:hypothetical protein